jgi:O-methyltransferase involved in polyketide biosynthesis
MRAGYLPSESFSAHFVPMGTPQPLPRRPPIINIGTALRCRRLDECVERFLSEGEGKKQIVSLGAGSDARFWRIQVRRTLTLA